MLQWEIPLALWGVLLAVVILVRWLPLRAPTRSRHASRSRLTFSRRRFYLDFEPPRIITLSKPPTEQEARDHSARIERIPHSSRSAD